MERAIYVLAGAVLVLAGAVYFDERGRYAAMGDQAMLDTRTGNLWVLSEEENPLGSARWREVQINPAGALAQRSARQRSAEAK